MSKWQYTEQCDKSYIIFERERSVERSNNGRPRSSLRYDHCRRQATFQFGSFDYFGCADTSFAANLGGGII